MLTLRWSGVFALTILLVPTSLPGQRAPTVGEGVETRQVQRQELRFARRLQTLAQRPDLSPGLTSHLAPLGSRLHAARIDPRSRMVASLVLAWPLLPGAGDGNNLGQVAPGGAIQPQGTEPRREAVLAALRGFLAEHEGALGVAVDELGSANVTVHRNGELIQIMIGRQVRGVEVLESRLNAVIRYGNLVLLGTRSWGPVKASPLPGLDAGRALATLRTHLAPFTVEPEPARRLVFVPTVDGSPQDAGAPYRYRLAWRYEPVIGQRRWEALVDATSGELLAFRDTRHYQIGSQAEQTGSQAEQTGSQAEQTAWQAELEPASRQGIDKAVAGPTTRRIVGGVYPVANDGVAPDGVEQAGYPMPFVGVDSPAGPLFSDGGGNLNACIAGVISTTLEGRFAQVFDVCDNELVVGPEQSTGDLDLGSGMGIDCAVPLGGASGNTHAARTSFYELSRVNEIARSRLPGNAWLKSSLSAVTNFPSLPEIGVLCNAFWDGVGVTFFESDASLGCTNTGELAGVIAHEWGHGLDNNDAAPFISYPGEGIADIYSALHLDNACIGRGFFPGVPCDGFGDPCTACDGVRDIDWRNHSSDNGTASQVDAHDLDWVDANCLPPFLGDVGPCGGAIHCEGIVYSEAVWDLYFDHLRSPPYSLDANAARELASHLTYFGAGAVGDWFQCADFSGGDGCNVDGGYWNYLAADDTNGNLADGTPHMQAIYDAFHAHGIACDDVTVQDGGCQQTPTTAPGLTVLPLDRGASLSWTTVAGATTYEVYRGEGVLGCGQGRVKVAELTGTTLIDSGLLNGHAYNYVVVPVGDASSCFGPASPCVEVTPGSGPNAVLDAASVELVPKAGDGDEFLDNCELSTLRFDLYNVGDSVLTNLRLVAVEAVEPASAVTVTTDLPLAVASTLGLCESALAAFDLLPETLESGGDLVLRIAFTADELGGVVREATIEIPRTETDTEFFASKTFTFDAGLEDWAVTLGTFTRETALGGAQGSSHYLNSSAATPDQCDQIRSPLLRLGSTSTLSVWTHFDIEPTLELLPGVFVWFDRANVALQDAFGNRTPVEPDGGRLYNAGGDFGTCVTEGQAGWADSAPSWMESTFSATALGSVERAGQPVRLDFTYSTDAELQGEGLRIDQVTVTNFHVLGPDTQSEVCSMVNQFPDAMDDNGFVTVNAITIGVLTNDSDPDGDPLRIDAVTQPAHGSVVIDVVAAGLDTVTYTPEQGYEGSDSFTYTIRDGNGGTDTATVSLDVLVPPGPLTFTDGFESGDLSTWNPR